VQTYKVWHIGAAGVKDLTAPFTEREEDVWLFRVGPGGRVVWT
jgi:hypothetical protein